MKSLFARWSPRPPDHLQTLHEFTRFLTLTADQEELFQGVAARLCDTFGLEGVAVFLRDGDGASFRAVAARGTAAQDAVFPAEGKLARWLRVNEAPLFTGESPGVMEFLDEAERRALAALGAAACVPLVAVNRLTGFLTLGRSRGGRPLDPASRELLLALAGQAALAFENAALAREGRARLKRMYRAERLATAGELAAGAAHEIRNPLAAIRSAIQYLRGDYAEGSDRASLVDDLLSEVDRIDGIVEGLLSFARPPVSLPEPVELPELLGQSVGLVAARARGQRVSVALDVPPVLSLHADPNQLKQVLLNVFLNALQAMPDGGELRVSAAPRGRAVELRVADTGPGIAPEHLDRVFDPFFTTRPEGTGLGLSICYGIVERHGGEMEVRSEPGSGTEVVVRLPCGRAP
ncbi:MAG TPA: ATP-binding protein [Longimicrobiaceae bacterium]|nr:ATP-binding protein [Longimicrobiaceae bacterium]